MSYKPIDTFTAELEALKAEKFRLRGEVHRFRGMVTDLENEVERLKEYVELCDQHGAEVERLTIARAKLAVDFESQANMRKALEFYASQEPWTQQALEGNHGDWGNKARAALAAAGKETT